MSDNQNIAGSAYKQTKGTMEPEKEREPHTLCVINPDIVSKSFYRCLMCSTCLTRAITKGQPQKGRHPLCRPLQKDRQ
jgi:hypothetical protein